LSDPAISIVIPVFNRSATIREAIESVLRQTWTDFELIVVDDCSADDSVTVIQSINDPRIQLVRLDKNSGISAARNAGIAVAKGEWIAFQDSDDEWLPRKLEMQYDVLSRSGPDTVGAYCGMLILGDPSDQTSHNDIVKYWPVKDPRLPIEGDIHKSLLHRSLISTQTFIVRRDILKQVGGFDPILKALVDWDCFIRIAKLGRIAFVPEPLVIQRFSGNSVTKSKPNRVAAQEIILQKNLKDLQCYPDILSERYVILAGGLRHLGQYKKGLGYICQAISCSPLKIKYWFNLILMLTAATFSARA